MATQTVDVLLVGGGVMSVTLGTLLTKLDPSLKITLVERLDQVASESTSGWNNAGTGHAGYCELNYTPEDEQGNVSIERAFAINTNFEISLQFWSYLVQNGGLPAPKQFINPTPHSSFVWGEKNVAFLRQRHQKMSAHHLFQDMEYSEDPEVIKNWMPLVMAGRPAGEKVAATRMAYGSDVDFGSLTRHLLAILQQNPNFRLITGSDVHSLRQQADKSWYVGLNELTSGSNSSLKARFVFLGAGGGALPLLQAAGVKESLGYGGFPVSGQWLVCKDPAIVKQHHAKVYGKAALGAPPMSVPHLDTRIIDGEPALLFGPYAGFTTKFLKEGSWMDLIASIKPNNLLPIMQVGLSNMDLTRYLISEVLQSHKSRVETLRQYFPNAKDSDWSISHAGQRVQIIKKDKNGKGSLEFGTELVASEDRTLAALLGASPGASVSVKAMVDVLERCFAEQVKGGWNAKLKEMIPSYGEDLATNKELLLSLRKQTLETLALI
ncbi:MAG: hypothetical protein RL217_1120 [Pseudomonadota bacterium]|jgi:malate dehydrogenase (quinone)